MNKKLFVILALMVLGVLFILNLNVSYYQGINYSVRSVKIPFYVKIIDFMSRDYHYKEILSSIIDGSEPEEERVFKIFRWSHENVRPVPAGFPVIDDHVWHIIIRGYGTSDQGADVFTTLCNYAGIKAFFNFVRSCSIKNMEIAISFVKIKDRWFVFDPFYNIYLVDGKDNLIDIETVKSGVYFLNKKAELGHPDYRDYICNLPNSEVLDKVELSKANIQSPLNRILYQIKKLRFLPITR